MNDNQGPLGDEELRYYRGLAPDPSTAYAPNERRLRNAIARLYDEVIRLRAGASADGTPGSLAEESERQYRLLFEDNPHPMWIYEGGTLAFLAVNDAAVRHYGYAREEFLAMTLRDIRPPEEVPALEEQVAARRRDERRKGFRLVRAWKHRKRDGTLCDVEVSVSPVRFQGHPDAWLALATDVTERKRLEAQFFHAQKLESVGRLAGAIAHDFNNLLAVISGYGEIIARQLPPSHPSAPRVAEILKAAARAADLTRPLLAFSRKQASDPRVLSLADLVKDHEDMFRRLVGATIEVVIANAEDLGGVKVDPGQLSQVLVNLVVNARDAMPSGGRLIIETENVVLDDDYAAVRPDVKPGPYVSLLVSDTGVGMSAETLGQVFEPFFTTKPEGSGTGLGLSTAYGIVKQSGGYIWAYSEPGKGTTFRIYLPRVDALEKDVAARPRPASPEGGHETVLVVEDNAPLRTIVMEILEGAGYRVVTACNGEEAVAVAAAAAGSVDLVITDVVMPVMGGAALAERLHPARFLFMSGYSELAVAEAGTLAPGAAFLEKPFSPSTLLRKVREVLDSGRDGPPASSRDI
jgi:two-component system cell cycle sensor histidine kinase/response regulator CckA